MVSSKNTIIFTGGGSGGHVVPALTMIKKFQHDYTIIYIGRYSGIEKNIMEREGVTYYGIQCGKLRRYFSWENFLDLFKIFIGLMQAFSVLLKYKKEETLIFSFGGFVCIPVVIAGWLQQKMIFVHEQTSRVGLANKIASKFALKVFVSFEDSLKFFPKSKTSLSGYPLRDALFKKEVNLVSVDDVELNSLDRPILYITGGGNGSKLLNDLVVRNILELSKTYFIIHQVGEKCLEDYICLRDNYYHPVGFIGKELVDVLKLSKVVISRAGAGTVCELMSLQKRSVFIPLKIAQKNEQFFNAMEAKKRLNSLVIEEDQVSDELLLESIEEIRRGLNSNVKTINLKNGSHYLEEEVSKFFTRLPKN
jgi:UDP-N-acetylglucosamine--N-acetylmuramyl-(pentapeptide) pyrophosphoryl-undecaprenol N-acetylglucosamine transferase